MKVRWSNCNEHYTHECPFLVLETYFNYYHNWIIRVDNYILQYILRHRCWSWVAWLPHPNNIVNLRYRVTDHVKVGNRSVVLEWIAPLIWEHSRISGWPYYTYWCSNGAHVEVGNRGAVLGLNCSLSWEHLRINGPSTHQCSNCSMRYINQSLKSSKREFVDHIPYINALL